MLKRRTALNTKPRSIALLIAALQLPASALSADTDLADLPMAIKNTVAPNVFFTLDDSGSMQWEAMPDSLMGNNNYGYHFPPHGHQFNDTSSTSDGNKLYLSGTNNTPTALIPTTKHPFLVDTDETKALARIRRSSAFNTLYYDPSITYSPWSNQDGTLMPNALSTAAMRNPMLASAGTIDLTVDTTLTTNWLNGNSNGIPTGSTFESRTYFPATYFKYNGGDKTLQSSFTKVEIRPTTTSYPKASTRIDCIGDTTCTYAEEIQNFANWFSYYRSRTLMARAGVGRAFAQQKPAAMRVGYGVINQGAKTVDDWASPGTVITGVRSFENKGAYTYRSDFFSSLYNQLSGKNGTPLRSALDEVGQYFESFVGDKGPFGENPGVGGGTQFSCRQNYHILMTDGYWNWGQEPARAVINDSNVDNTDGDTITGVAVGTEPAPTYKYTPVNPYKDSSTGTLADVAMYYWKRDLRTDSGMENDVPTNSKDPAFWQHVVQFTVGLGVTGTVSQSSINSAFTPSPATITWPTAAEGFQIDDLAHAAVNGRGGFFSATNPSEFSAALTDALNDITGRSTAAAAVAVSNPNVTASDNFTFATKYSTSGWWGSLNAYRLDIDTGLPLVTETGEPQPPPPWSSKAEDQLELLAPSSRVIATYSGTNGISFTASALTSSSQLSLLNTPNKSDGADVLAFTRGDRSKEGTAYFQRTEVLGDIINAEPLYVAPPRETWQDPGYGAYKADSTVAARADMIYVGANDGMLHAFDANTGAEKFAYVPSFALPLLNGRTTKSGITHKYLVDGLLASSDVDFATTPSGGGSNAWGTLLVGGLGKGGRGFFALDVKNPTPGDEATLASQVKWEFPNSSTSSAVKANVGYSFGRPVIAKVRFLKGADLADQWVVLLTSGYNNGTSSGGDGKGYLFVLDAANGELIRAIATTEGSASTPSGLAQISAFFDDASVSRITNTVYGGDLQGNVWRFDLSNPNPAQWGVAKITQLVTASGAAQPITVAPELARIKYGTSFKRMVYFGTGRYLGDSDVPGTLGANAQATQTQTIYTLVDDGTPIPSGLRANLIQQTLTTNSNGSRAIAEAAGQGDLNSKRGCYLDLNVSGERVVTDPAIGFNSITYTTNTPSVDACKPGGSSAILSLPLACGSFDTPNDATDPGQTIGNVLASRPVLIKLPNGKLIALIRRSDAKTSAIEIPSPAGAGTTRRRMWRELIER